MPKIFSENDRELIRSRLIETGAAMLEDKRYKSISVEDIALDVGVAKGTFYNFFRSKEVFFYEVMQFIKERNRAPLKALPENADKEQIAKCLYERYMYMKTNYDYFTTEDIKQIYRRLPEGDSANDSEAFAEELCSHIKGCKGRPKVIVSMFNIMAIAKSNKSMMSPEGYEAAVRKFSSAMAEYIIEGE